MGHPPGSRHHTVRAWHLLAAAGLALALAPAVGCSLGARRPAPPEGAPMAAAAPRALVVQLVFGSAADLDLYVTDPLSETVYFGNNPSSHGGVLAEDVRCDGPTERVEVVRFEAPRPGRYRVGVDYPERCLRALDPVPFVVQVDGPGVTLRESGAVSLGEFQSRVLEVEVAGAP